MLIIEQLLSMLDKFEQRKGHILSMVNYVKMIKYEKKLKFL